MLGVTGRFRALLTLTASDLTEFDCDSDDADAFDGDDVSDCGNGESVVCPSDE